MASLPLPQPCPGHDDGAEALMRDGYVILKNALERPHIQALERDLDPSFATTPFCSGDFYGARTKRFGRLLVRSAKMAALVQHPAILGLAARSLGPWCDCIQLNLTQATEIHPGALAQFPHRDQDMWRGPTGTVEYLLNVMWPLTPFTDDNGATLIWPGSHGEAALGPDPASAPVTAVCDPGDAILFLGSTLHGAGANRSAQPRRGLIVSYCLGWLKPYENQWLAYPPAIARSFPPELAALVGYRQHRPNLGNYEGQCPSVLLAGEPLEPLGAVDALRPDQEQMLADFVGTQRRAADRR
jgi:ectoine hydroxylase-related dioxygenase (phytanoyl-CoA dioxygenase family)